MSNEILPDIKPTTRRKLAAVAFGFLSYVHGLAAVLISSIGLEIFFSLTAVVFLIFAIIFAAISDEEDVDRVWENERRLRLKREREENNE